MWYRHKVQPVLLYKCKVFVNGLVTKHKICYVTDSLNLVFADKLKHFLHHHHQKCCIKGIWNKTVLNQSINLIYLYVLSLINKLVFLSTTLIYFIKPFFVYWVQFEEYIPIIQNIINHLLRTIIKCVIENASIIN